VAPEHPLCTTVHCWELLQEVEASGGTARRNIHLPNSNKTTQKKNLQ
jgi:hypothetical protein